MIGTYDLIVALLSVVLSLGMVGVCLRQGIFRRYVFANLYILISAAHTVGGYIVYSKYGYNSSEYFYFYYIGDAVGSMIGYLLVASFFDQLLRDSIFRPYIRPTLGIFFFLVVGISALFVWRNYSTLYSSFLIELQQNMFFVGVLLTFLLWLSMNYLHAESRRFVLLVSGLGIYFSAHAVNYALQFLSSGLKNALTMVPPLAYTLMVVLWLYTFWRVPEGEAAVAPVPRPQESLVKVKILSE